MNNKKVLLLYNFFDPAYKAGGPIRSLVNLVKLLEGTIELHVLCTNQDHDGSLLDVESDQWVSYGEATQVQYLSPKNRTYKHIRSIIAKLNPDLVYINGMYSLPFVVFPLRALKRKHAVKMIIAPRGMLQSQALSIKPLKKKLYLFFLKLVYLGEGVHWQVTTAQERTDLINFLKTENNIHLVGNVPTFNRAQLIRTPVKKKVKVFGTVALISPMKNIHLILEALGNIKEELEYHLYGPIKDHAYWQECQDIISKLPLHIKAHYAGEVPPSGVAESISGFDFYIQPSKSENFGHSIFEAFNQGVPVIISDQTPWKNLPTKNAGWDVDLNQQGALLHAVQEALSMDGRTYQQFQQGARKIAEHYMAEHDFVNLYLELFS